MAEGFPQRPLKKEQQDSQEKTRAEARLEDLLDRRAVSKFDVDSFCPPFTHTELALKLVDSRGGKLFLIKNLSNFEEQCHIDIARRLIEKGRGDLVVGFLSRFKGADHVDIAHLLIKEGDEWSVARYLPNFKGLDSDIAHRLIEKGYEESVANHLSNFEGLDSDIARRLIEKGYEKSVDKHLSKFEGLDSDIAHRLIEAGSLWGLVENLSAFKELDHADIVRRIIETGNGMRAYFVAEHLSNFEGLDADIAHRLIEEGYGGRVALHLSSFKGVDHTDIARRLIEKGSGEYVALHLSNFEGLDHTDIARRLIEKGSGEYVALHLSNFEGLDHTDIAHRLIETEEGKYVADHLSNFKELGADIAHWLFKEGHGHLIAKHLSNFKELGADIAHWLIKEGYGESAAKYLPDSEKVGFHESDPYERHPWRLTEDQASAASVFSKLLAGDAVDEETLREAGIDRVIASLPEWVVNRKIEDAHQSFLGKVRDRFPLDKSSLHLTDDQREEILNPPVRLRPLPDVIRSLVARYLVQMTQRSDALTSGTLIDGLDALLEKGFRSYAQAYTVDIPLYDKLYDEFDNLRDAGRYPLEVYVGRDGIYAWIGRRAQDVARRRKMGREKRMEMKEKGEVLEINPKYIVYPRYFRDNMKYEVKRQLLEQEGVSPDADPLFYDTGYVGTILEQMMRIMEFDEEEIDRRMRLLSATTASRRVRGIPDDRRSDVVERIEGSAKPEETAEGLIVDEKTGKIRHIAKPVPPDQFFDFMMIKQAISRHYWTKDHLHREQSGNANFDSEHHTIRIREAYKDALPEELFVNPAGFLDGQTMLTARDGRDIVVETVQSKKMKEAQQEFSVLIAAKKAGLPVTEPVGIISEKGGGGGYVLVEKLEGHHGQDFEKWLQNSGSFSEKEVKEIMSDVRNRHRSVAERFKEKINVNIGAPHDDNYIVDFDEEAGEVRSVTPVNWM